MDLKNILIIFGLSLCFHASQGKVQFEDLFKFGVTSFDDIVEMKAERFEKLEKNVSLHRCKYACVDNTSCHGAVFSEINSDGCFPTNCTHFFSRGLHGECHLLIFKDDADVIDFAEELTGKRRNYFLNLPTMCRPIPIPQTKMERGFTAPEVYNVARDKENNGCYIFKYRCRHNSTAVGGNVEARCCDNGTRTPVTLQCQENKQA